MNGRTPMGQMVRSGAMLDAFDIHNARSSAIDKTMRTDHPRMIQDRLMNAKLKKNAQVVAIVRDCFKENGAVPTFAIIGAAGNCTMPHQ